MIIGAHGIQAMLIPCKTKARLVNNFYVDDYCDENKYGVEVILYAGRKHSALQVA